jgi:hypothetical protein
MCQIAVLLYGQRMAANGYIRSCGGGQSVSALHFGSDIYLFGNSEGVVDLDAEVVAQCLVYSFVQRRWRVFSLRPRIGPPGCCVGP